jgi:predicted CoA-binding protein
VTDVARILDDPTATIAVIGATDDPSKYGGIVYRQMKGMGYRVMAVNPGRGTVDGDPAYPDLAALPERPDIVNFVVPASTGARVADEALELGYTNLWFQPGAESPALTHRLMEAGASVLEDACIMVRARWVKRG